MAKSDNAKYAPGELGKVRDRLGPVDWKEAKELADKLGGEVGRERSESDDKARQPGKDYRPKRPTRRVELAADFDEDEFSKNKPTKPKGLNIQDDPGIQLKPSYWERLKMDRFAAQPEFEIKSGAQILHVILSIFSEAPDHVSYVFVTRRMSEYYKKIETLVVSTRTMFPRNNARRSERMRKSSPLSYSILDVIRHWNIEKISADLTRIQARPRSVLVSDFSEVLKAVYRPLFVLEMLDPDAHIRGAFKVLYKLLYVENPDEAKGKAQELIRIALAAFFEVRRDIRYLLYPLLMKSVSSNYVHYNDFFTERKNRIMAFLNVSEADRLDPAVLSMHAEARDAKRDEDELKDAEEEQVQKEEETEEDKDRRSAAESEKKALERGFKTLEALFPQAGWDKLASFPDLYPYFVDTFDLRRGVVNIAPTDPLQQVLILMRILEELFYGLRHVSFGSTAGATGMENLEEILGEVINGWRHYLEISFGNEYLPRMTDYIRILEGSTEERISPYARKLVTELHWIKRLYFLPYYKFESLGPPTLQRKETEAIFTKIKTLRKYLAIVAAGIEQGNHAGGAEARATCEGINNPWEPYTFQVPNPLSIRLNALIPPKGRNNASLIYFCLAVTTVLDHLVNSENSWAYSSKPGPLFRSVDGGGITPLTGVDSKINADALFRQSLKRNQKN